MTENLTPVQQRLYDFLPEKPRWGFEKQARYIAKKDDILFKANYIQLPTQKKKYVALDLDYELAGAAWMNDVLPEPTVTIINRENYTLIIFTRSTIQSCCRYSTRPSK